MQKKENRTDFRQLSAWLKNWHSQPQGGGRVLPVDNREARRLRGTSRHIVV
jgi:hypothetical protein